MMKPAVTLASLLLLAATASAETVTTEADTLVVVTPNAPVIVQQGDPQSVTQPIAPPGAAEMPPAPVAPANGAPQNEAWSDVSHVNGTLVKVGERGDYLYKFKKTNIATNPIGLLVGLYDFSVTHALSQNLALSGSIMHVDDEFTQFAATMPIYFKRTYSGPFIEPGLLVRSEKRYSYDCYDCSYGGGYYGEEMTSSWTGPQMLLGWHWTFDSGLNLAAAFGVAKRLNSDNDYNETEANGYFRVGYAF